MKKSVILILIAVYVISIGVVGYFGLNVRIYAPNIPPSSIEITHVTYLDQVEECKINKDNQKYIRIRCDGEQLNINLRITVKPDDATNKSVTYSFDPGDYVTEKDGNIVIKKPTDENTSSVGVWITVRPVENLTISDEIYVSVVFG